MFLPRDLILIKLDIPEKKILLPEEAKDAETISATKGEVIAIGPDCETVKVGDRVHYKEFVGHLIEDEELGGGVFVVVSENDVLVTFR